jgi:hypothetical protein
MNINICSAIIGAITGALIGWFVSWRLFKLSEYHKAFARFRTAFVDTIYKLNTVNTKDDFLNSKTIKIIKDGFVDQEKAIILFEPYISKTRQRKLNEAYKEYKEPYSKNRDIRHIEVYSGNTQFGYIPEEARQLSINNIDKITDFAKFKRFWF